MNFDNHMALRVR